MSKINKNDTIKSLNNYIELLKQRNSEYSFPGSTSVSEIDFIGRMPQIMALALWQGDTKENNEDVSYIIESFDYLVKNKNIPD